MEQYRIETHLHTNHTSKCGWLDAAALAEGYAQAGYAAALEAQRQGCIQIRRHGTIIEGHILPDKPKRRRGK